jgi:tetratricopeptide (TPR) repeat protein
MQRLLQWGLGVLTLVALPAAASDQAEKANSRALVLLAEGDATGAEAAALEALSDSSRFDPRQEISDRPEKGLLFEDMIAQARSSYRQRRGRYFLTLGRALTEQERWVEARKALGRAAALNVTADPDLVMASHADLSVTERIEFLLRARLRPGVDPKVVEGRLMETGAFPNLHTLETMVEHRQLKKKLEAEFSDLPDIDVWLETLPEIRSATERGTFVSTDHLRAGATLVFHLPAEGCNRCSEELDGINRAIREVSRPDNPIVFVTFVKETDLETTRRISRLLALRLQVGRLDRAEEALDPDPNGEIRVVARGGLFQARIPLAEGPRSEVIRRMVVSTMSAISPLDEEELQQSDEALQQIQQLVSKGRSRDVVADGTDLALKREAGPASVDNLYRIIERAVRSWSSEAGEPEKLEVVAWLSRLEGAGGAKERALAALDSVYGQKLLASAKGLDPSIERQAPASKGVFYLGLSETSVPRILLQRTFVGNDLLKNYNFILEKKDSGLEVVWSALEIASPKGVESIEEGAVFIFENDAGLRGVRLVGSDGFLYEKSPALILEGLVVEVHDVLVEPLPGDVNPRFFRRGTIEGGRLVSAETALERGLRLFREGQYREAASAFEEASKQVDPLAPYDETDLRFNLVRCLEEQGKIREALALADTIGDVAYQHAVDERIKILESGGR